MLVRLNINHGTQNSPVILPTMQLVITGEKLVLLDSHDTLMTITHLNWTLMLLGNLTSLIHFTGPLSNYSDFLLCPQKATLPSLSLRMTFLRSIEIIQRKLSIFHHQIHHPIHSLHSAFSPVLRDEISLFFAKANNFTCPLNPLYSQQHYSSVFPLPNN